MRMDSYIRLVLSRTRNSGSSVPCGTDEAREQTIYVQLTLHRATQKAGEAATRPEKKTTPRDKATVSAEYRKCATCGMPALVGATVEIRVDRPDEYHRQRHPDWHRDHTVWPKSVGFYLRDSLIKKGSIFDMGLDI
jgi:hypothetical protein